MNTKIIPATPFGLVALIWTVMDDIPKIVRVLLSKPGVTAIQQISEFYRQVQESSCREIDDIADGIAGMLEGADVNLPLDVVDLSLCGEFQQRVLQAEHGIPRGRVSTYRLIARHLGVTNGARAVGNALANNPFPLIVPCHRAIRSDRTLGGYQGGLEMKRALLEGEGIQFDGAGRVRCPRLHYEI